jgi:type II secretory pathway component PulC
MKSNVSPEERLLRLIRGHKNGESKANLSALNTPFKNHSAVFYIRKFLLSVLVIACIYLIAAFIYPQLSSREIKLSGIISEPAAEPKVEPKPEIKPFESYLEGVKDRQIFNSVSSPEPEVQQDNVIASADLIRQLNLIGIIAGDSPQAVIEDKTTQKTYYLNRGQSFGEFQVEQITDGKVILNSKGKKFELYM